jgi:hypothetical protein
MTQVPDPPLALLQARGLKRTVEGGELVGGRSGLTRA